MQRCRRDLSLTLKMTNKNDKNYKHMSITKDFIVEQLKSQIQDFEAEVKEQTVGRVVEAGDGIARVDGISDVMMSEMLEIKTSKGPVFAVALNLEEENVGAVVLGESSDIKEGDEVICLKRILDVPVGEALVGRVVNPLGEAIDGKGDIDSKENYPIEKRTNYE